MEKVLNRIVKLLETLIILVGTHNWLDTETILKLIEKTKED